MQPAGQRSGEGARRCHYLWRGAMYVKNDDDSESLLNFTVEGEDVVIHRVSHRFVLRRGRLVACIENRSFDGGGERLQSETLVPGVERQTKGVRNP